VERRRHDINDIHDFNHSHLLLDCQFIVPQTMVKSMRWFFKYKKKTAPICDMCMKRKCGRRPSLEKVQNGE